MNKSSRNDIFKVVGSKIQTAVAGYWLLVKQPKERTSSNKAHKIRAANSRRENSLVEIVNVSVFILKEHLVEIAEAIVIVAALSTTR